MRRADLVEALAEQARALWEAELQREDSRELLEGFVRDFFDGKIGSGGIETTAYLMEAVRAIRRALAVDMSDPANRKGELPKALGLVARKSDTDAVLQRVVCQLVDHARHNTGRPGRSLAESAALVVEALAIARLLPDDWNAPEDNVRKIYQRFHLAWTLR